MQDKVLTNCFEGIIFKEPSQLRYFIYLYYLYKQIVFIMKHIYAILALQLFNTSLNTMITDNHMVIGKYSYSTQVSLEKHAVKLKIIR